MDRLYVENFFNNEKAERILQDVLEKKQNAIEVKDPQNLEPDNQIEFFWNLLEEDINKQCKDPSIFHLIMNRIVEAIESKNMDAAINLFDELEELLEIECLPSKK